MSGNYAPVTIDSTVTQSYNSIIQHNPELASAIKTLGGFIENSGNKEAAEYFKELYAQLATPAPNTTIMRSLWSGIVAALPQVKTLTDVATAILAMLV